MIACERLKAVKIGWSATPHKRFLDLKTANPYLELLAYFPTERRIESMFHEAFRELRIEREWFLVAEPYTRQELIEAFLGANLAAEVYEKAHGPN